jgi:hypothetical protein
MARKGDYNRCLGGMMGDRYRKEQICRAIRADITARGGTFLVRNEKSGEIIIWTELGEKRIKAKISQALREGGPTMENEYRTLWN